MSGDGRFYYKVLGIEKGMLNLKTRSEVLLFYIISGSDSDTVRRAYLQKSREHHPDKHPDDPDAEEKMAEISKANAILSHEGKKEVYDAYGSKVTNQINMPLISKCRNISFNRVWLLERC